MTLTSLEDFNYWLEKVQLASRVGTMPPGEPPRPGLVWKPETHRWIRPEQEEVREEKKQPRIDEIRNYVEQGGYAEIAEKAEDILLELFPDMLNPTHITRIKDIESIQEKEQRPKYKEKGINYTSFTDIVGGRVEFDNANQITNAVKLLKEQSEKLGFKITQDEDWVNNVHPSGYYRRHHLLLEMDTDDGKTVTMELQLGTVKQTKIADWSHDLLHKKSAERPVLNTSDRRAAIKYIKQMSELYAYYDGVKGARNIYPAECIEIIRKFAGCLDVPES